jgi:hypothetical protein
MKCHIKNFQSIEDVDFDISGFTVIVGKTNIGKSAIIRSLKSALHNVRGTSYIRSGEKTCSVKLSDGKDVDILWEKGDGNNYTINGKEFKNVGFDTPIEIENLGFKNIQYGDKVLTPQISDQFSPLFLIDETGSTCANVLFDISRIEVLNEAQRLIDKDNNSNKSLLKTRKSDIIKVREELNQFEGIEKVREAYVTLSEMNKLIEKEQYDINQINTNFQDMISSINSIKKINTVSEIVINTSDISFQEIISLSDLERDYITSQKYVYTVSDVLSLHINKEELDFDSLFKLESLYNNFNKSNEEIKNLSDVFVTINTVSYDTLFSEVEQLKTLFDLLNSVVSNIKNFESKSVDISSVDLDLLVSDLQIINEFVNALLNIKSSVEYDNNELKKCSSELSEIDSKILEIKSTLNVCPLCETIL